MLNSALRNVGGLLAVLFLVTFLSGSPALAQSDEFSTTSLSSFWFWIREDPTHWSLKTRPGYLRIVTQKGDISTTLAYNARNILLQGTSSGDFVLTTRVRIFPSYDYQQGGLIAYVNDDNYVKLVRSHILSTGGGMVELVSEVNAKMSWLRLRLLDQDVWLRLTLSGTTFTGDYSLSGKPAEWFGVGSLKASFTAPKVGLMAINGMLPDVPELPVDFDFFRPRVRPWATWHRRWWARRAWASRCSWTWPRSPISSTTWARPLTRCPACSSAPGTCPSIRTRCWCSR